MVGSSFVADTATSLDAWLNEGAQILHDKLVEAYGSEYLEKSTTATTTTATDYAPFPADFYKLLGVDLPVQGPPSRSSRICGPSATSAAANSSPTTSFRATC